jgi:hypothetical protein
MLKLVEVSKRTLQVLSSVLRRIRKKLSALYNWGMADAFCPSRESSWGWLMTNVWPLDLNIEFHEMIKQWRFSG